MEEKINAIESELEAIKIRNAKVEADKAWETSLFRKCLIAILTYIVVVLFFYFAGRRSLFFYFSSPWFTLFFFFINFF